MEHIFSEQMVMVIFCSQLASTWIRSPYICKVKLTYLVIICQILTWIWRRNRFGRDSHGSCTLLSVDFTVCILICTTISFWKFGAAPRKAQCHHDVCYLIERLDEWASVLDLDLVSSLHYLFDCTMHRVKCLFKLTHLWTHESIFKHQK